ncbi:MAG: GNAT family N-acetyltransferase [Tetragenococcus koreensis]
MESHEIKVIPMINAKKDISHEIAAVFVDGYKKELAFLSANQEKLIEAFEKMLCPEVFYFATLKDEIVGILACSNNQNRALTIDETVLANSFGDEKGKTIYQYIKDDFNKRLPYSDDTGYIECVATVTKARGRGVSTALINDVLKTENYNRYVLEVTDTNAIAYRLYKKLGFVEFKREKEKYAGMVDFDERIFMELYNINEQTENNAD